MGSSVRRSIAVCSLRSRWSSWVCWSREQPLPPRPSPIPWTSPPRVSRRTRRSTSRSLCGTTTKTQMLGSANVTAPTGFTITSATPDGTTVELRNLNTSPGGTVSRSFTATTSATVGAVNWSIIAKQANDYNGSPGNNLTLDAANSHLASYVGTCVLSFVTQPTDAKVGANVTSVTADPAGTPVRVEVLNGPGGSRVTDVQRRRVARDHVGHGDGRCGPHAEHSLRERGERSRQLRLLDRDGRVRLPGDREQLGQHVGRLGCVQRRGRRGALHGHGCNGNAAKNNVTVNVTAPLAASGDLLEVALDLESLSAPGTRPWRAHPSSRSPSPARAIDS